MIVMETSKGIIKIELWQEQAPATVENFVNYVKSGYYAGTIFHRVIPDFMIQGGGFDAKVQPKPAGKPIRNEASAERPNRRGTIAMARTSNPHSATSQFFINVKDNRFLDKDQAEDGWGYAAFGKVVEGMDVVDKISRLASGQSGPHGNVPIEPVVITAVRVDEPPA